MTDSRTWTKQQRCVHWLCAATALATLVLVMVGGLVTNTGSALAVPDWPTTFGYNMFTYPPSQWVGGVLYEHSHRLLGSLVGFLTILLVVAAWRWEVRPWVRWLAVAALLGVIVQGVLGGMRVVLLRHDLAIVHGIFAQAFFGLVVSLWVFTSESWQRLPGAARGTSDAPISRAIVLGIPVAVYIQIILGALLTHRGQALWEHVIGASVVASLAVVVLFWVIRKVPEIPELRLPAFALAGFVCLQLSLGLMAYLWHFTQLCNRLPYELGLAILAAHRITGTLIWASSVVLALRSWRALSPSWGPHVAFAEANKAWT